MTEKMEILNNRLFAVDPSTLFNAFADPEKLKHWWGPHDFTNRIDEFDFREGGSWRITMTASDGTDFDNHSTFKEIVPARRIDFIDNETMQIYTMEMTFSPESNGTRLHWRMLFEPTEENRALEKFITAANEQNFDRLEQVLDQHAGAL